MKKNHSILVKYHEYPELIRRSIHSTNTCERMNKEIRRRIKIGEINEKWSRRSLRAFHECLCEIIEMFQKRYHL